jgi:hypothetical protein
VNRLLELTKDDSLKNSRSGGGILPAECSGPTGKSGQELAKKISI